MRLTHSLHLLALSGALLFEAVAMAQAVAPTIRILNPVDESNLITLRGNTHPLATAKNDRGRVSPDLPMSDLILVLSRSPEQQDAFDKMVASQYDPNSPNFHRWLTPEQVGADFGPSEADIATISTWLTGHGFSIAQVTKDRMSIRFSGTAAEVENTFHTEIHNLEVKGVHHIGNISDPMIPAALAQVVVGVKSLHNFFARPQHRLGSNVKRDSATGHWQRAGDSAASFAHKTETARPEFGISVPASGGSSAYLVEDVTPYDFATIYNILPLWNASSPIDGTGQTVAIAGTSAINAGINVSGSNGQNDVATFRSNFGLPTYSANQFTMVSGNSQPLTVCTDPGTEANPPPCIINDLMENTLDVEWAGSIAKGANIVLVASYPASSSDDNLYDSERYIVDNDTASIMNVSYGECELANGTAGNVEYYNLWQTASSEGIAVFVASGDAGSPECDDGGDAIGNPYSAQFGLSVSGLASTPFNTAVGGTDFNWCSQSSTTECAAAPYWNSTNAGNGSSAIGYVPEVPWNDTCAGPLGIAFLESQATFYSVAGVTDAETACNFVYNYWSAIDNSYGVDLSFYVDTVGTGGGASGCVANDGADVSSCLSTTTSTGAANGSISLVQDGWPKPSWQAGVAGIPSDGVRDIPDISFFGSDGFLSSSAYLICVSALNTNNAPCSYSTTSEPFEQEVGGTSVSTATMSGVMALINQKAGTAQGSPNAELYKLAANQTYSNCSAESVKANSTGCYFNDIDTGTNAMPCDYGATEGNPPQTGIQSPNCSVLYSGDLIGILPSYGAGVGYDEATGLGSMNVANVVNGWPITIGNEKATVTVTPAQTTLSASSALSVPVTVASSSSSGATPTGTVTLSGGGYTSTAETLSSGAYTFSIPANSLSAGTDTLTVTYSGDTNYASTTGTATVTVTANGAATVTVAPAQTTLSASSSLSVPVTVASSSSSGATPTGTVTLSGGGYTSTAETLSSGAYTFSIPANSLFAGTDTLTVTYSGDTNYASATGTATVTVTAATSAVTFTLSATTPAAVTPGTSATSTLTVDATNGYAGTVTLACALTSSSPSATVDNPTCSITNSTVTLSSTATTGTTTMTVTTTAATTALLVSPQPNGNSHGRWTVMGGGSLLALVIFLGIPARRRSWRAMLGAFVVMVALGALSGCGNFWNAPQGNSAGGTTAGTYTFTITGTGSPAVSSSPTTTFSVTVN
jgi:hypothetical protein